MEIKVYTSDKLGEQFKKYAMRRFGYGRGSISSAAEEAITRWLIETDRIYTKIDTILESAKTDKNIIAVFLFGSYARKEYTYRDADVAILVDKNADHQKSLLKYDNVVGNFENRIIDISIMNDMPLDIQSRILNEAVVLYVSEKAKLYDYSIIILEKWSDFKPRLEMMIN